MSVHVRVCMPYCSCHSLRKNHTQQWQTVKENNYIRINRGAAKRWARKQNLTTCSNERHRDQRTTDRQTDGRTDVPDALPEALAAASHTGTCLSGIYTVSKTAHFLIMYPHTTVGGECRVSGRPSGHPSVNIYMHFAWRHISVVSGSDFNETRHKYSSCEWALLKRFSRSLDQRSRLRKRSWAVV